ncbi:hypothetical protein SUGI_0406150 [Cryptomeria japonica]|nr:hypothetical protein SUGI_0406150 [Cryptomeria japonica]
MAKIVCVLAVIFLHLCCGIATQRIYHGNEAMQGEIKTVMDYGAVGDGSQDDSKAFKKAWEAACISSSDGEMVVPSGSKFLINPTTFPGPCKSPVSVKIEGEIIAPAHQSAWNNADRKMWLTFANISALTIQGGGTIDGQGQVWWEKSCRINEKNPCTRAPTAMYIGNCTDVLIRDIHFLNSQQIHLGIFYSSDVQVTGLLIRAPEDSPNTDGIHLESVENVQIDNCDIETGDDCISITAMTSDVRIQKIRCGPGHGISIGSLGEHGEESNVEKIDVREVVFDGSQNGARIKTWQGGSGYAREITFADLTINNVSNPIVIDQYYCDSSKTCKIQKSAVQIESVTYQNITGTSAQQMAVNFNCSQTVPCKEIMISNVDIKSTVASQTKSACFNAFGLAYGNVYPNSCLKKQ